MTKAKAKIDALDKGGLLLAASELHPDVAARKEALSDSGAADTAAGSLEDLASKIDALGSMTDLFTDDAPPLEAPAPEAPQGAASPGLAAMDEADEEVADFDAPLEDDDAVVPTEDALTDLEGEEGPEVAVEESEDATLPVDDLPGFDGLDEGEAAVNAEISDRIIEFQDEPQGQDEDLYHDEREAAGEAGAEAPGEAGMPAAKTPFDEVPYDADASDTEAAGAGWSGDVFEDQDDDQDELVGWEGWNETEDLTGAEAVEEAGSRVPLAPEAVDEDFWTPDAPAVPEATAQDLHDIDATIPVETWEPAVPDTSMADDIDPGEDMVTDEGELPEFFAPDEISEGDGEVQNVVDEPAEESFIDLSDDMSEESEPAGHSADAHPETAEAPVAGGRKSKLGLLAASVAATALIVGAGLVYAPSLITASIDSPAPAQPQAPAPDAPGEPANETAVAGAGGIDALPPIDDASIFPEGVDPAGSIEATDEAAREQASPALVDPDFRGEDRLESIARGLESGNIEELSDLMLPAEVPAEEPADAPAAEPAPVIELEETLAEYAKAADIDAVREEFGALQGFMDEMRAALEEKDGEIERLDGVLAETSAQAARAEQLALAQNEILVKVIRVQDKVDRAETLIVDLSRRVAALETTDPADRVAVERSLKTLDSHVKNLTRDIGLIARVAINGSPLGVPSEPKAEPAAEGGDPVFAEGGSVDAMPASTSIEVPDDVAKGDFVEGFGYVLDIFPTTDGSTMVVMENGTVLK
ncbi:hypothetical protein [Halovulum marinum]|uniref:hypothetical protein n=1 Tax=Halovulum marinum TaxID=2662447 RepID=UPI0012B33CE1|nr:hypothetical protein [Halovulum marinum]